MTDTNYFQGTTLDPSLAPSPDPEITPISPISPATPQNFFEGTTLDPSVTVPVTDPVAEPNYEDMPWSEVGVEAVKNIVPSTMGQAKNIWTAISNPKETGSALLTLGKGVAGKTGDFVVRSFGGEPQKWEEKEKGIAALDNLLGHYGDTYGSKAGFKKALATDPASIGMDAASLATGVGGAMKLVGVPKSVANATAKTLSLADPIQLSIKAAKGAAKLPAKVIGKVSPYVQGSATGVPANLLKTAREIGLSTDDVGRGIYKQFVAGKGDFGVLADTATQAVDELRTKAVNKYLSNIDNLKQSTTQLPVDSLMDTSGAARGPLKELMDYVGQSGNTTRFVADRGVVQNVYDQILDTATDASPTARTFIDLDNLKQSLNDMANHTSNVALKGKISAVANHIKQMVVSVAPEYEKIMSDYQKWSSDLRDFKATLGASNAKVSETTKIAKMLRATKTGKGRDLLADLAKTQAGKYIPNMLAGVAASQLTPPFLRGVMETGLIGAGAYFAHPAALPALGAAALNTSPRIASKLQYSAGALNRTVGKPLDAAVNAATSQPLTYGAAILGEQQNDKEREGRARGGAVDHEVIAESLVRAAFAARAENNRGTESLLNTPDEHIVKALGLANKYS